MDARRWIIALAMVAVSVPAFGEGKAYEVYRFRGKAEGLTIAFDYASGYPEASKLRITEARTGKTTKFVLGEERGLELRFVPEKNRDGDDEVIFKLKAAGETDDEPAKFSGVYRVGGKTISLTLTEL